MNIRLGNTFDVEAIIRVQYEAVHRSTITNFYSTDILQSWAESPTDENRRSQLRSNLEGGDEILLVAELDNKLIIGFGSIVPTKNELRGLYVHLLYGRQGIGAKILKHLEILALQNDVNTLQLDASLNAENFYSTHGYLVIEYDYHYLQSGVKMECVKMNKKLQTS